MLVLMLDLWECDPCETCKPGRMQRPRLRLTRSTYADANEDDGQPPVQLSSPRLLRHHVAVVLCAARRTSYGRSEVHDPGTAAAR